MLRALCFLSLGRALIGSLWISSRQTAVTCSTLLLLWLFCQDRRDPWDVNWKKPFSLELSFRVSCQNNRKREFDSLCKIAKEKRKGGGVGWRRVESQDSERGLLLILLISRKVSLLILDEIIQSSVLDLLICVSVYISRLIWIILFCVWLSKATNNISLFYTMNIVIKIPDTSVPFWRADIFSWQSGSMLRSVCLSVFFSFFTSPQALPSHLPLLLCLAALIHS